MAAAEPSPGQPKFSVVIPTYNRRDSLEVALRSVLGQSLESLEVVVVDDGSTDATADFLDGLSEPRLKTVKTPNRGRCAARNTGIGLATGEYVTFLDSDDRAKENWLERLASKTGPRVGMVFCGLEVIAGEDRSEEPRRRIELPKPIPLLRCPAGLFRAGTFSVRSELLHDTAGFDESIEFSENTELGYRLAGACKARGMTTAAIAEPLVTYNRSILDQTPAGVASRLQSAELMLERHRTILLGDRGAYATYCRVAGVSAGRLGKRRQSLQYLWRAFRSDPGIRHLLLLIRAVVGSSQARGAS